MYLLDEIRSIRFSLAVSILLQLLLPKTRLGIGDNDYYNDYYNIKHNKLNYAMLYTTRVPRQYKLSMKFFCRCPKGIDRLMELVCRDGFKILAAA